MLEFYPIPLSIDHGLKATVCGSEHRELDNYGLRELKNTRRTSDILLVFFRLLYLLQSALILRSLGVSSSFQIFTLPFKVSSTASTILSICCT
jgi:hypothetical protein